MQIFTFRGRGPYQASLWGSQVTELFYAITNCQFRQCETRRHVNQRDNN